MATAEILSIGTELLLGDVLDTNAQFLAVELAELGIDCFFRSTVGDNKERISAALRSALNRADIVITTGGLGPTPDDLTTECLAEFFHTKMVMDRKVVSRIEAFFSARGLKMPESNKKQALKPESADWLPNPNGTAPGLIWSFSEDQLVRAHINNPSLVRTILTFPGVPSELKMMWKLTAKPFLAAHFVQGTIWSCELKHYGIGESALAEKYANLLSLSNPTVAPYAGHGECRLRVAAKSDTITAAKRLAKPIIQAIQSESGLLCYGRDQDTLESVVGDLLSKRNLTVSTAESCTGGWLSKRLTDRSGSSQYISLNVVTYSDEAKLQLLQVPQVILQKHGAVSAESARAMAVGVRRLSRSDIAVSITGIAGPTGATVQKPVGLVYIAIAAPGFCTSVELRYSEGLSRDEIRYRSTSEALNRLRLYLLAPDSFVNDIDRQGSETDLIVDYSISVAKGTTAKTKTCQIAIASLPAEEADKLRTLLQRSGVLSVSKAYVDRAANLVSWKLTVRDSEGTHEVISRVGQSAEEPETPQFDTDDLLDFLNPYLQE